QFERTHSTEHDAPSEHRRRRVQLRAVSAQSAARCWHPGKVASHSETDYSQPELLVTARVASPAWSSRLSCERLLRARPTRQSATGYSKRNHQREDDLRPKPTARR